MSFLTRTQRDELRTALLGELVLTKVVALSAEVLAQRIHRSRLLRFEFSLEDLQGEIEALHDRGFLSAVTGGAASAAHYQATTAGVLEHERGAR